MTMENTSCHIWMDGRWKVAAVASLIAHRREIRVRCQECHGAIKLHRLGKRGTHRAHAEHLKRNPGCSLGDCFDGTHRPALTIVDDPIDVTSISEADFPEQVQPDGIYSEGSCTQVLVNAYERNPKARAACIKHHGVACKICGIRVRDRYSALTRDVIHVHHLRPLSDIQTDYMLDPKTDLIPVCPLCHAVIHSRTPIYSPDEVRSMIQGQG